MLDEKSHRQVMNVQIPMGWHRDHGLVIQCAFHNEGKNGRLKTQHDHNECRTR
jgi:hypothetical protein